MESLEQQLDAAIINGKTEEVGTLISAGAQVNIEKEETPLFLALKYNRPDAVRVLIEAGAQIPNTVPSKGSMQPLKDYVRSNLTTGYLKSDTVRALITSVSPQEIPKGLETIRKKKEEFAQLFFAPLPLQRIYNDWEEEVENSFNRVSGQTESRSMGKRRTVRGLQAISTTKSAK